MSDQEKKPNNTQILYVHALLTNAYIHTLIKIEEMESIHRTLPLLHVSSLYRYKYFFTIDKLYFIRDPRSCIKYNTNTRGYIVFNNLLFLVYKNGSCQLRTISHVIKCCNNSQKLVYFCIHLDPGSFIILIGKYQGNSWHKLCIKLEW